MVPPLVDPRLPPPGMVGRGMLYSGCANCCLPFDVLIQDANNLLVDCLSGCPRLTHTHVFPMPILLRSYLEVQRLGAFEVPFCDVTWLSQMGCPMEEHGISWEVPGNFGGLEVTSGTEENSDLKILSVGMR